MTRQIGLLTLVCCFVFTGNALAQREVPPPSTTPLNDQAVVSQSKPAPKPVRSVQAPAKAKKDTLPAPVQAAALPTTDCKSTPEKKSEKATKAKAADKKAICPVAGKPGEPKPVATKPVPKKPAAAEKPKKTKPVKICKTTPVKGQHKVAQAKKNSVKTANKPAHKRVYRATTVPLE